MSNNTDGEYKEQINKEADRELDYADRLKQHKRRTRFFSIAIALVLIITVFVVCFVRVRSTYGSYSVKNSVIRKDNGFANFVALEDGYIKFGHDGAVKYNFKGTKQWEKTYEINNPVLDKCGNYIAVADIGGTAVYLFDKSGFVSSINTALPIIQMDVSGNGLVVTSLEDTKATYINMYNKDNEKIYSIKSVIEGDGFPVSFSVSDSGNMLMVSYAAINKKEFKNSVVFYNFGEVGHNEVERVVAGFDGYKDKVVSKVEFISQTRAVAYGENVISIFEIDEYPNHLKDIQVDFPIRKVFYSDKYIGYTYINNDGEGKSVIYSADGKFLSENSVSDKYSNIEIVKDKILMFGKSLCCITKISGKNVFEQTFDEGIVDIMPVSGDNKFLYISGNKIQYIELKHGG